MQETDHSTQSDPNSNNGSDSYHSSDEFSLNLLQIEGIKKSCTRLTDVLISGDELTVKLDTGAEVNHNHEVECLCGYSYQTKRYM